MFSANMTKNRLSAAICVVLALVTLAVYWPITRHGFIGFDDPPYITENPNVQSGLTWQGLVWAFKIGYAAYWQPVTWISHMLDCQLFGLHPAGHHLVNILFHISNALLLFYILNRLTGSVWRSFFVAAFFAWHPLRVESVAWAAERKDVLSAFFFLLTLCAYAKAVSRVTGQESRVTCCRSPFYWLALAFFALGLMSKPMIVTLPLVLLLLDFWPLNRLSFRTPARTAVSLLVEKSPFFVLSLADSVVMFIAQKGNPSVWSLKELPLSLRVENLLVSCLRYVSKLFWPTDMAILYPLPHHWPAASVAGAALLLVIWTGIFLWRIKKNPYLVVGWFWFLGTLMPVIGLMQIGMQSMADRFSYLPDIGLLITIVWGANDLLQRPTQKRWLAVAGSVGLAGCLVVTSRQIGYWQSDLKLFAHAVKVTTDNYPAEVCLGEALERAGRTEDALALYADAVRIEPDYPIAQFKLAMMLIATHKSGEAYVHLQAAAQLMPHDPNVQYNFGVFLAQQGRWSEAVERFRAALREKPDFAEAKRQLSTILAAHPELH